MSEDSVVKLAVDQKPEDFKAAIECGLNDRLRGAIADRRASIGEALGKPVNKHDMVDKKRSGDKPKAADPKASGKDMSADDSNKSKPVNKDDETDKKRVGSKPKAAEPKA